MIFFLLWFLSQLCAPQLILRSVQFSVSHIKNHEPIMYFINPSAIFFLKNLQIAWDDAKRLAKRRIEREQGRNEAADDLSELSEGEKEKGDTNPSESVKEISRINSDIHIWTEEDKARRLYIVLIRYCFALRNLFILEGWVGQISLHDLIIWKWLLCAIVFHVCMLAVRNSVFNIIVCVLEVFMDWCEEKIWNLEEILTLAVR